MAIKYNIDRLIAWIGFHRSWYFWNYIKPYDYKTFNAVPTSDYSFYGLLLLTSLPFLVVGLLLTIWRLRSAKLPLLFSTLFFVPVLNLVFFVILSMIPAAQGNTPVPNRPGWMSWLPKSKIGSASLSTILVALLGSAIAELSAHLSVNYGLGLFIALPFIMGLIAVLLYAASAKRSFESCMTVAVAPVLLSGLILLATAVEGVFCLIMAAPIAAVSAFLGGLVGYLIIQKCPTNIHPMALLLLFLCAPIIMGMEQQADPAVPLLAVKSSVIINASIKTVWSNVISFSPITEKRDWLLQTGIAYPITAHIDGHGVGAIRHCVFNSGEFVEPIEMWEEPHLLRFSVSKQPQPMQELSPYRNLKTPHLDNYLLSKKGEFKLTALSCDKTLLEGTTWYSNRMWPVAYWQLWSDLIIHHIHMHVLNHIKAVSEHCS